MKTYIRIINLLFLALLCIYGCSDMTTKIGRSISRWDDFGVKSMCENRAKGIEYLEVTMNSQIGKDSAEVYEWAQHLLQQIDSSGLSVWSVHLPYSSKIDISVIENDKREKAVEYQESMIRIAAIFNPQCIVLHPSSEPISPVQREYRIENSRNSIGRLAEVAEEIGAILCVENLPRTCLGQNAQEMIQLIDGYDNVGICFDVNHLLYQSHDDFLNEIPKGKIKTVNLSDYDFADERHLMPGIGKIEWKSLWDAIKANGYDGIMMFECHGSSSEFVHARDILTGAFIPEKDNIDADSLAFCTADWQITDLGRGAMAMYSQVPMFFSTQSICCVKYPSSEFKSEILHRPGVLSGKPSEIGRNEGAMAAVNAGYFHVKERIPSVYFRIGDEVYGNTHPTEVYRVDGVVGFMDKEGKEMVIEYSDTTQYESVSGSWHTVMASGPMLLDDGKIVVPLLKGGSADGANVSAMQDELKKGSKIRTHYSSAQFYDKRHPRAAVGTDDEGNIYYVVIDGRFEGKGDGASIYETAYICKMLGMTDAINLDGGGSCTLWSNMNGVINHPYDNKIWDHEGERAVPNLIVAY